MLHVVKSGQTSTIVNRRRTRVRALALCAALALMPGLAFQASGETLKAGISKTDLGIDLEGKFGIKVRKSDKPQFKAVVDSIRPGSMAFYSGLRNGDKIIKADGGTDKVVLTFDRDGKVYSVGLAPRKSETALAPRTGAPQAPLSSSLTPEQQRELIGKHDVVLIIDRTGSMQTVDCPNNLSRWNWCRDQANAFMQDMSGYLNDLTIVTFAESYDRYDHVPPSKIAQIFANTSPTGGTNAAAPLHTVLTDYFRRRAADGNTKPVMIAMITDGLPNLPGGPELGKLELQKEILSAIAQMKNSAEVTLTFLQVGNDYQGGQFLTELSERLGVPYDIVDTKTFDQMKRSGLREALIDALGGRTSQRVQARITPAAK